MPGQSLGMKIDADEKELARRELEAALTRARALIFDCDGTLVDTPPVYARAWAAGLRLSGIEMPIPWYMARAGMSEYRLMDAFEEEHGVRLPRDEVVRQMRAAFVEGLSDLREIQPVAGIARLYHGQRPMAVASGGSRAIVTATLEATKLRPLFDTVVTVDDVAHGKPEPDLFLEAARRLGTAPAECLVFEDTHDGLLAAERAGTPGFNIHRLIGGISP